MIDLVSKNVFQWLHRTVWLFSVMFSSSPQNHTSQINDTYTCLCCFILVLVIATDLFFIYSHQYSVSWALGLIDKTMWYQATIKHNKTGHNCEIQWFVVNLISFLNQWFPCNGLQRCFQWIWIECKAFSVPNNNRQHTWYHIVPCTFRFCYHSFQTLIAKSHGCWDDAQWHMKRNCSKWFVCMQMQS